MVDTFKRKHDFKKSESATAKRPPIAGKFLEDEKNKLRHDTGESEMVVVGEISKGPAAPAPATPLTEEKPQPRWDIFLAYFFTPIGSLVLYLLNKEEKTIFHCKQSAILGILAIFLSLLLIGWLVWLFGLYVGYKAAIGEEVEVPLISSMING